MTDAPDFIIRPSTNVHTGQVRAYQPTLLNQTQMDLLGTWGQNVANKDSLAAGTTPVSGSGVTGSVRSNSVGIAPATSVSVDTTNMLVSQDFSTSDTIVAENHWSWDGTDGDLILGCARVDCDGLQDDLISSEIPVVVGESIEVSCQVKWETITYTGTRPILLGIEKYRRGKDASTGGDTYLDIGGVDLDWITSPASDGGWGSDGDLAGIYVVEAGVDQLRFRLRAASAITDGTVKFDECVFLKLDMIDDAAVPGVGTTVDDIVRNLFGAEGENFTHNDAAVALANTSTAITSINARLSANEASQHTGAVAGDDFSWSGKIIDSPNWGGVYTLATSFGYYTANGSDAVWHPSLATPFPAVQTVVFDWEGTDSQSQTDYQLVQLLLSSAPASSSIYKSYIHLLGRIDSSWGSYTMARFGSDGTWEVKAYYNDTFHTLASGTCPIPGAGSLISFYLGDKTTMNLRHFKISINNQTPSGGDFDEVGAGSQVGASNRKWGWGAETNGGLVFALITFLPTQAVPPKVNQWLGYDQ